MRYANQLPSQVESLIVSLKRDKPHWGARKTRELLLRRLPGDLRLPAKSTIHAVLDRPASLNAWENGAPAQQARPCQKLSRPTSDAKGSAGRNEAVATG